MRTRLLTVLTVLAAALATAAPAGALSGLTIGFSSDPDLTQGSTATRAPWIGRAVSEGAQMVRIDVMWSQVAPAHPPAGFDPSDPASPGYDFSGLDGVVRDLEAHGLTPLLTLYSAPRWAEGPHLPRSAFPGSWAPSATQYAAFAQAVAQRYDGSFPDPENPGQTLPRVRYFQAWNEPNLYYYLSPQWKRHGHGWAAASPQIYRKLLNGLYGAVKGVSSSNVVVMGGTAPYGDPPGGGRMWPVYFDRDVFCLSRRLKPLGCGDRAHLDAVDHHPYEVSAPTHHAYWPDDAAVPDMYKIGRVLRAAVRTGRALPRAHKQLMVTELTWDSNPPNHSPGAAPIATQARYVEQADYILWRQGVSTVLWLQLADRPVVTTGYESGGMYFASGQPKPAATAFRFPFVVNRSSHGRVAAWGRAPAGGGLTIEREEKSGRWMGLVQLRVGAGLVFQTRLNLRGGAELRAQVAGETSLSWRLR